MGPPPPKPQRQRRKRRGNGNPTPGTMGLPMVRNLGPGLSNGEVTVQRSEMVVSTMAAAGSVVLTPMALPWLKNLAQAFERVRWLKAVLEYRPLVGTSHDGSVAVGFDWMSPTTKLSCTDGQLHLTADPTKSGVLACTPSFDTPVWQRVPSVPLPASRLMSRAWYEVGTAEEAKANAIDFAPGSISYVSTAASVGEIWIHYKVVLSGTHSV